MDLRYKTIKMSDPKGKPKVWFSCHPDDFGEVFPLLSDDLLRHANCAVWYNAEPAGGGFPDGEEELLSEMQLVMVAVTPAFLYEKNQAREQILPFALKEHIPVLPIQMQNGLERDFNRICANIQVVSRYVSDPTASPYEEVLSTFLSSVLVGDTLAEQVRNAFDAYVFLSYRKKDRRHAQRLMRLIHEDPQFRDIAIWYDEYLVPGEGFNEAILAAFQKSSLFAMAVTPHLQEQGNYVMQKEYPMARDREKAEDDFAIVSVEMYDPTDGPEGRSWRIDQASLKEHKEFKYREITDLKDEHRPRELNETFLAALSRIAKKENDGSAQHRFFIGLAYLNGIDVEPDPKKALTLLTGAAQDKEPCMDATAKLADMYRTGDGVPADPSEAVRWQRLLSSQYRKAFEKDHDPDQHKGYGTLYFKSLQKLSDLQREAGSVRDAIESAREALAFSEQLKEEVGEREQERDSAVIRNRLGSLYRELGDAGQAIQYYQEAAMIYERLAAEIGTARALRDLSVSYERLGDLCRKSGNLDKAEAYYGKALKLREDLNEASGAPESRRDLSSVLTKLGNVRKAEKDYEGAARFYGRALAMDEVLSEEVRTPQARDDYAVSLTKTGDILKAEGRMAEAAEHYKNALVLFKENLGRTSSKVSKDHCAAGCEKLAGAHKKLGDLRDAAALYQEARSLREELYEAEKTEAAAHALAAACYNEASFLKDKGLMRKAYLLWNELCASHPEYGKYRDRAGKLSE